VFATVHTAFSHPIVAAKQCATADQIGHGRFGLNIVCGWNSYEYEMFGIDLPTEHSARYAFGQEWFDIAARSGQSRRAFDWHGEHFTLKHVAGAPSPISVDCPPILNAASSGEGRAFAVRNADFLFTVLADPRQGQAGRGQRQGRGGGRGDARIASSPPAMSSADRPTRKRRTITVITPTLMRTGRKRALHGAAEHQLAVLSAPSVKQFRGRFAGGNGVFPIIGSPDTVADTLAAISGAGFDGTTVAFVNYTDELPYFCQEVLPRLEAKGLRQRR